MKTKGFDVEALRQDQDGPLEKLVAAILIAAVKVMQLVAERDGEAKRPFSDVFDPDDQPALERVCQSLEGKTEKQKNPHPRGSLALAAWVFAETRRMDRLLRQARPHRHAQRPHTLPRHQTRLEPPKCVNLVGSSPRVGDAKGRVRRIAIVALARKLMVALWRYLETGVVPDGAVLHPSF